MVNNLSWQHHTKPGPETIVWETMAEQPNKEAAIVLSDVLGCPGKGGGAVWLTVPSFMELNYSPHTQWFLFQRRCQAPVPSDQHMIAGWVVSLRGRAVHVLHAPM